MFKMSFKKIFKNRKTLKFKYLILWEYGFAIYFLLRPFPNYRNGDFITNYNLYNLYRLFPVFIYLIIFVAIVIEFLKLNVKGPKNLILFSITLPLLIIAFILLSNCR